MSTITSLGFNINSNWDGSGVKEARRELGQLAVELQAISRNRIVIDVDVDSAGVLRELDVISQDREMTLQVNANTGQAAAEIAAVAHDRNVEVNVDTDRGIGAVRRLGSALDGAATKQKTYNLLSQKGFTFAQLAAFGFIGAINLMGPAISSVSALMASVLPLGMIAAGAIIVRENEKVREAWRHLGDDAGLIFKEAGKSMAEPIAAAADIIHDSLWELKPVFTEAFEASSKFVEPLTRGMMGFVENVMPGVRDALQGMMPLVNSIAASFENAGTRLGRMFTAMGQHAEGLGKMWEVLFDKIFQFIEIVGTRGAEMAAASAVQLDGFLGGLLISFDGFLVGLKNLQEAGGAEMAGIWIALGTTMSSVFQQVMPPLGRLIAALSPTLNSLITIIGGTFADLATVVLESLIPAVKAAHPVIVAVASGFQQLGEWMKPIIPIVAPLVAGLVSIRVAIGMLAALSPVAYVIRSITAALTMLMAHPVVALAMLAAGVVYLATQTTVLQDTWNRWAPDWAKRPFEEGVDGTSQYSRALDNVKSKAGEVWASLKRGLGNLGGLFGKDSLQDLWRGISDGAREAWEDVLNAIRPLWDELKNLFNEVKPFLKVLTVGFLAFANTVWEVFQGVVEPVFRLIGDLFSEIIQIIRGVVEFISGALRTIKGVAEMIIGIVRTVIAFFSGDWEGVEAGMDQFGKGLEDVIMGVGKMFEGVWTFITAIWDSIVAIFKAAGRILWSTVQGVVEGVVGFFQWLWDVLVGHSIIPDTVNAIVDWFFSLPGKLWGMLTGFVEGVVGFFADLATRVINSVIGWIQGIWNQVQNGLAQVQALWSAIWDGIRMVAQAIWDGIRMAWDMFLALVRGAWDAWSGAVSAVWNAFWDGVKAVAQFVWDAIKLAWDTFLSLVRTAWDIWSGAVRAVWDGFWNAVKAVAQAIWDTIKAAWDTFLNLVRQAWDVWSNAVRAAWDGFWNTIKTIAQGVWDAIKAAWDLFTTTIRNVLDTLINGVKSAWEGAWNTVRDIAQGVWDKIRDGFTTFKDGVISTVEGLVGKVKEVWERITGIFEAPVNAVKGIWNTVAEPFGLPTLAVGGEVQARADGGAIYGPGGPTEDKVPALLSHGEHVWTAREVNAAGGHQEVRKLRENVLKRRGYAEGGAVEWMWGQVRAMEPSMQLTSSYRSTNDYHGQGKAVDVSNGTDSTPEMRALAGKIAAQWGARTLELIHSPFNSNIKDGRNVGDGFGFYGAGTMGQHRNHVHWAVPGPLDGTPGAPIGSGGGYSGPSPEQIAAHRKAVDEMKRVIDETNETTASRLFSAASEAGKRYSGYSKTKRMKDIHGVFAPAGDVHGAGTYGVGMGAISKLDQALAAARAAIGGSIPEGERAAIISKALELTRTPPPDTVDAWMRGMNTLITRESNWNPGAVNNWDSNAANGNASRGLAQVVPTTFAAHKVPGYENIDAPVDNVAASVNYIKSRYGSIHNVQQANANMPPKGYAEGIMNAPKGWAWTGENGPELVRFRGGEQVRSFEDIIAELKRVVSKEGPELHSKIAAEIREALEDVAARLGMHIEIPMTIGDGVNDPQEVVDLVKSQVVPQLEMLLRQKVGRK